MDAAVSALEINRFHWELLSEPSENWAVQVLLGSAVQRVQSSHSLAGILGKHQSSQTAAYCQNNTASSNELKARLGMSFCSVVALL